MLIYRNFIMGDVQYGLKTAELRKNVQLYEFVVMPNHFHGILEIMENNKSGTCMDVARNAHTVGTTEYMSSISPKSGEIGTIIRAFKSAVTKSIHNLGYEFAWQRNMWEHIVRDAADYARIADYIENNPFRWKEDMLYKE